MTTAPVVTLRAATEEDADALSGIGYASFTAAYGSWSSPEELETHLEKNFAADVIRAAIRSSNGGYLLASVDNAPAGMVYYRDAVCPAGDQFAGAIEIHQLYIKPDIQRVGLGARLVQAVIEIAEETASNGIWLSAWEDAHWALQFYEKVGFGKVGETDFYIGSVRYNDLLLWRPPG